MKPTLIVFGNCQAEILKVFAECLPEVRERYDVIYDRSFDHPTEAKVDISAKMLESCDIFFGQRGIAQEFPHTAQLPATCRIRQFPVLDFTTLWPLRCDDPRNRPEEGFPFGRFPYGDRVGLALAQAGAHGAEAFSQYMQISVAEMPSVERLLKLEELRYETLDRACDIAIGAYILKNFRSERLFWTHNHPNVNLIVTMLAQLFDSLGDDDLASERFASVLEWLRTRKFMSNYHQPVHPRIAETLQLAWWSDDLLYNYHDRVQWPFDVFMTRYIDYAEPPELPATLGASP